jgi:sulfite reductase (ferredoxin)
MQDHEKIFVEQDAMVVLKYHGSYMQDNRDQRVRGEQKKYSFMLRLKSPCGEVTPELYRELDNMADQFGQNDLRATTRQAWQLHGILKGDLKSVISTIMKAGSSSVGACGDVSRNVMCTPAPFATPEYKYARQYSKVFAELFKPQSQAFTELWMGEEKVAKMEYWMKDIDDLGINIQDAMLKDKGTGIMTDDPVEPLYGSRYLPRKFKIAVTVPGDNSLDIYTNDLGYVVVCDKEGRLEGFNVMVGGGMGRTHMKDTTFARTADHLGFVSADDALELGKAILATQRDHGNREIRANSRMKYLVHEKGIDEFRDIVEGYFGKKIAPWREIKPWKYVDWMGWHAQGDGNYFLGINIEQGRIRDFEDGPQIKKAMREIVDRFDLTQVLTPTQSIIFRDIKPDDKRKISYILRKYGLTAIKNVDPLVRQSMACPALPLCGLAVTEAERRMPDW